MTRLLYIFIIILCTASPAKAFDLEQQVIEYRLKNGMRWLLLKRTQAPIFSGMLSLRVGSIDEVPGKTGLAHMFEHMVFKGSSELGTLDFTKEKPLLDKIHQLERQKTKLTQQVNSKNNTAKIDKELKELYSAAKNYQNNTEIWDLMLRNGAGDLNAFTNKDMTAYYASMPLQGLELWMYVMAEMISEPVLRDFYTERDVVIEERRLRVENDPDGQLLERVVNTAFPSGPSHWPVIGFKDDIAVMNDLDAKAFHEKFYVAANMVGVIVGDIDIKKTKKLLKKYFSGIPPGETAGDPVSPKSIGGVRNSFKMSAEPSLVMAFHKPSLPHDDEYTFDIITSLLCEGKSSWLESKLVTELGLAQRVLCTDSYPGNRLNNLLMFWINPLDGASLGKLEKYVWKELEKLKTIQVSPQELSRVLHQAEASFIFAIENNNGLMHGLTRFETILNDWRLLTKYPERLQKVTAEDIKRVAAKYFTKENMIVVERQKK